MSVIEAFLAAHLDSSCMPWRVVKCANEPNVGNAAFAAKRNHLLHLFGRQLAFLNEFGL